MNRIIQLSDKEFTLNPTKKGQSLCLLIKGISFVMFYSSKCGSCKNVMPILNQLSRKINSCKFCIINVDTFPSIIQASQHTISPITYVPDLILYVNGKPFLKYQGNKTEQDMGNFVMSVINKLNENKSFNDKSVIEMDKLETVNGVIPFNIVCDGDLCYLTSREAYGGAMNQSNDNRKPQGTYSQVNDANSFNTRLGGQNQYQSSGGGRQALNGMFNPHMQQRNMLNEQSGM